MTFKIIDENTVEADGVIGVFVEGGDCRNCILAGSILESCKNADCINTSRDGNYQNQCQATKEGGAA